VTVEVPEFWTRTPGLRRAHRIDLYTKATIVQRDLRAGAWLVEGIPSDSDAAADLEAGGGIIVYYRGEVLDSGRLESLTEVEEYDDAAGSFVTRKQVGGSLDLAYVEDRRAHPDPITLDTSIDATKPYTGPAETALKEVVDDNLGPGANPTRVQPNFTIAADQGRGAAISDEVRFDPMAVLLAGWSVVGGVIPTCKVINGALVFDVYEPRDLTDSIVFSIGRATASRVVRTLQAPGLNYVWVGGQGEGTARVFVEGGDSASVVEWGFRREELADRRDTDDLGALEQTRDERLSTMAAMLAVQVEPLDVTNQMYLTDYRLGDLVTAVTASGIVVARQIREVQIECTPGEVLTIRPLVADPLTPSPEDMAMFGQVRDLTSRIVNQETR
jgi:hypothetical protein